MTTSVLCGMLTSSIAVIRVARWYKRHSPQLSLPIEGVLDAPLVSILVNEKWKHVILDAVQELDKPYAWVDGTDTDKAEQQAIELFLRIHTATEPPTAGGGTMPIGAIIPYATATPPTDCIACDGTVFNRVDYPDLYAALDTGLIIDADTFTTPDLRDRFVFGAGDIAVHQTGGTQTHTLTIAEMPAHVHQIYYITGGAAGSNSPKIQGNSPTTTPTLPTGGNQPHENMPPYYALKYCMVAK